MKRNTLIILKAKAILVFLCVLFVSNARAQVPTSRDNRTLLDPQTFLSLSTNAGYVVGIGTVNAHLTEDFDLPSGRYVFLCTGFLISNPELESLNVSLLVTAISCNNELKEDDSERPYYIIGGPMLFDLDKSIKRADNFVSFNVRYGEFVRKANNDFMYLVLPNTLEVSGESELDNEEIEDLTSRWQLPSTPLDVASELVVGEKVVLLGYSNLGGPHSYDCTYLGTSAIYTGPYTEPPKHTIGGQIFCNDLVGTEVQLHGLGGSPILTEDFESVVGLMTTYSLEDAFYELSTGAVISAVTTNGLVNFVPLIGAEVKTEDGTFSRLELPEYEDGILETTTLNLITGNITDLKIPIRNNHLHGEMYFRDDMGRVESYEKYEDGKLVRRGYIDHVVYDIFSNQNLYLVKSLVDGNAVLMPLNEDGGDINFPSEVFQYFEIDVFESGDIIRVPINESGGDDWSYLIVDEELKKFWFWVEG